MKPNEGARTGLTVDIISLAVQRYKCFLLGYLSLCPRVPAFHHRTWDGGEREQL